MQELARALFLRGALATDAGNGVPGTQYIAGWSVHLDLSRTRLPEGVREPREVIPASRLSFAEIRSIYRRDGLGAELVAVMNVPPPEDDVDVGGDASADTRVSTGVDGRASAPFNPRRVVRSRGMAKAGVALFPRDAVAERHRVDLVQPGHARTGAYLA
ncbi:MULTISPECIES: hypothetical protein [Paraburkholderia]|uniref:hypothetical protein n=1 Tax=Paraburkholderia TaxID=1822464 RepID=UPI000365C573|nr:MULTISPECIES: hypothetical protein [Paraburkholderia]MDH6146809.1 hypothetical protein [Paraburkholderia sp. WSM4179]